MSELFIYNTLSRQKEKFVPLNPGQVKMYCCGPTVYGLLHVGNFRGAIFYNLVRNWLMKTGYKVTYVYNFTDVDDKIIDKANQEGVTSEEIAERYIVEFKKDFNRLKLAPHDLNPKVTETIPEIKQMVEELVKNEHAYVVNGEVLYSIKSFVKYGKLSNRNTEELLTGVRIESDGKKREPLDFALWKPAKPNEPGWDSGWGLGRPGWHIECSAMIKKHLGEQIDIHGGGMDLIFPHHENEIAQSEAAVGKEFVRYWMHNNMLNLGGAKMSKSLGNILTGRDFMDRYSPEILKYLMLSSHYRSVTDFSEAAIENSIRGLARIYSALAVAETFATQAVPNKEDPDMKKLCAEGQQKMSEALSDDFNTALVMAAIFDVVRHFNSQVKRGMRPGDKLVSLSLQLKKFILEWGSLMSLFQEPPAVFLQELDDMLIKKLNLNKDHIKGLVDARVLARTQKDYKKSDEIRDELAKMGISISDTAEGTFWEVTK